MGETIGDAGYSALQFNAVTWFGTSDIAWEVQEPNKMPWLGRRWVCRETGEAEWGPLETVTLPAPPVVPGIDRRG